MERNEILDAIERARVKSANTVGSIKSRQARDAIEEVCLKLTDTGLTGEEAAATLVVQGAIRLNTRKEIVRLSEYLHSLIDSGGADDFYDNLPHR
jgi:hypothetical protein